MKATVYAYWLKYDWMAEPILTLNSAGDMGILEGFIPCGSFEADFTPEPFNQNDADKFKIASFRKKQGELRREIDEIEEKIQKLLCLPYKEEE